MILKRWFLLAGLVAFSLNAAEPSSLTEPTIKESDIPLLSQEQQHAVASKRITNRFTRDHYHRFALNDEFSKKIFNRYIKWLDYNKMFFIQSDIVSFQRYQYTFDDMLRSGDLEGAYKIFQVFSQRRYERWTYALSLLNTEMTFNKDGRFYFDRVDAQWAQSTQELNKIWKNRVKHDALSLKMSGKKTWLEIVKVLSRRYNNHIKRLTQTQSEEVFQLVMNSFARSIEPHTSYLSPRSAERFQMDMNLSLEGIGAVLETQEDYTVIRSLVTGGPADKTSQLAAGDKIIGVGTKTNNIIDVIGWRIGDVVELIKGPKGSQVVLQILRKKDGASAKPTIVRITRDKIYLEDRAVKAKVYKPMSGPFKGQPVGVLEIPSFYIKLSEDVSRKIVELERKNVKAIIVDLRRNGGGALTEATMLTSLFIGRGPVVQIRNSQGRVTVNKGMQKAIYNGPLVVLVDRYSASASEIFAAAIQDYKRGVIVGESTFGKGTVQQHTDLMRGYDMYNKPIGYVQYTIAKFYRVNGESTQLKGVVPDITFPSPLKVGEHGEAEEENALPWDRIPSQIYTKSNYFDKKILSELSTNYVTRIQKDPSFDLRTQMIESQKKRQEKKYISLKEQDRAAERKQNEQESLDWVNKQLKILGKSPVKSVSDVPSSYKEPDVLLDQSAQIALDLAKHQKKPINKDAKSI